MKFKITSYWDHMHKMSQDSVYLKKKKKVHWFIFLLARKHISDLKFFIHALLYACEHTCMQTYMNRLFTSIINYVLFNFECYTGAIFNLVFFSLVTTTELKINHADYSHIYNHTLAMKLVEYASAVSFTVRSLLV